MTRTACLTLLLLAPALLGGLALGQESFADLEKEFTSRIGEDGLVPDRVSLVSRVADYDDRDAAKLLMGAVVTLSGRVDALLKETEKVEKELAELDVPEDWKKDGFKTRDDLRDQRNELDRKIASHRTVLERVRKAALEFTSDAARAVVVSAVAGGADWRQRGIAAQAAATYPSPEGRAAALKALKDKEPRVALQALFGLRARKDPETAAAVAECLKSSVWTIVSAAAEALAEIKAPASVRPLIEAVGRTDGRVRDDVNNALRAITGQSFPADYDQWKRWFEEHVAEYEGEGAKPLPKKPAGRAPPSDDPGTYYGIPSVSKRIVYIIDISGSMELPIGKPGTATPREGEEERFTGPKVDIAKNELKSAIRKLPEDAFFNFITFNHKVTVWEPKLIQATQDNKNKAYLYIRDLKASGSTYTYGALREAFRFAGQGATDAAYASGLDTIFLLSDGAPTDQSFPTSKLMDPEPILAAVRQWNSLSKVVIHAIAIDAQTQGGTFIKFMKDLAEQNGGKYAERN